MSQAHILVFGSINIDLVAGVHRLPVPGETISGHRFSTVPGGKGANQAVAIARLGVPVRMVGRVGNDLFGQDLLTSLQTAGVQTDLVLVDKATHSGVAMIAVDDRSENHIIVIPGANGQVTDTDVERLTPWLSEATALLLQLEIPLSAVVLAARTAQMADVPIILDPAPMDADLPDGLYSLVDIITPNAIEAGQLTGISVHGPDTAAQAADLLQQRGVPIAVIKLGAQGVFCATPEDQFFVPAFPVTAVDTVAAGDAFNGALAAALYEGHSIREAIRWGAAAGAIAVTQPGAQSAMPDRITFEQFLSKSSL